MRRVVPFPGATSEVHADRPVTKSEIDKLHSEAFRDREGEVCDLARMARLMQLQVHEAVGELSFVDGQYTEAPNGEATELAIFAVSQMADMMKRFKDRYHRLYDEGNVL